MDRGMLSLGHNLKVLGTIICAIMILMVNNFIHIKWSSKNFFHHITMLINVFVVDSKCDISMPIYPTRKPPLYKASIPTSERTETLRMKPIRPGKAKLFAKFTAHLYRFSMAFPHGKSLPLRYRLINAGVSH